MKRIILVICLVSIGFLSFAQTPAMPEKMAHSELFLRPGISELNNITVGQFFLNKKFKSIELLDGTKSSLRYGTCSLKGNTYVLVIELTNNSKVESIISYTLTIQDYYTLLDKVSVKNFETKEYVESSDIFKKSEIVSLLDQYDNVEATKEK